MGCSLSKLIRKNSPIVTDSEERHCTDLTKKQRFIHNSVTPVQELTCFLHNKQIPSKMFLERSSQRVGKSWDSCTIRVG